MTIRGSYSYVVETRTQKPRRIAKSMLNTLVCLVSMMIGFYLSSTTIQETNASENSKVVSLQAIESVTTLEAGVESELSLCSSNELVGILSEEEIALREAVCDVPVLEEEIEVKEEIPEVQNELEDSILMRKNSEGVAATVIGWTPCYTYELTEEERQILERVVEAEVTGTSFKFNGHTLTYDELLQSKIRVAQVFYNRVKNNEKFKHITTIKEACLAPGASSTLIDGRYYSVSITDITREAVELAFQSRTPDYSEGALFFSSGGSTSSPYGKHLFTDEVNHAFFK